jgi:Xaa-Pro dipeptidase
MSAVYSGRQQRLLAAAREAGLAGLVLYSDAVHSFIELDPVWYATGLRAIGPSGLVIADGLDPVLFVTPTWDLARATESAAGADIETRAAGDGLLRALAAAAKDAGLTAASLGVVGAERLTAVTRAALNDAVGAGWADFDQPAREVAMVKDTAEQDLVRRASWIAEEGYRQALADVRPGMKEFEFAGRLDTYMHQLGADDNFLIVSASRHNRSVHAPSDRILADGDILLAEISPSYQGAFAQICRTAVIGEPSKELADSYEMLRAAFASGLAKCHPGTTMGEIVEAVNEPIEAAGFAEFCRPPYMRTRGHGMGLGSPYPVSVATSTKVTLAAGMTFVLHPNQYLPTVGYLMCGDHLLITDEGPEVLSAQWAQLDSVAG